MEREELRSANGDIAVETIGHARPEPSLGHVTLELQIADENLARLVHHRTDFPFPKGQPRLVAAERGDGGAKLRRLLEGTETHGAEVGGKAEAAVVGTGVLAQVAVREEDGIGRGKEGQRDAEILAIA